MPRPAFIDSTADRWHAFRKERARKARLRAAERKGRGAAVAKVLACVLLLAVFAALGFVVGDDDYHAILVGWLPFGMVLFGIVLAGVYAAVLRWGVTFEEQLISAECERGSQARFAVVLRNRSPFLATRLDVAFFIGDLFDNVAHEMTTSVSLGPFEYYELPLTTKFDHIGAYRAGLEYVRVSDFLGLFTSVIENSTKQVVRVTPIIQELADVRFSDDAIDESANAAKSVLADSMDYAYVREYEPGDPLKTIHWKLSARAGSYMTRLYEVHTNPSVAIVMDFYGMADEAEDLMGMYDAVVESALSLARFARRNGMEVQLRYRNRFGVDCEMDNVHQEKLSEIIDDLPRMSNDPADAAAALENLEKIASGTRGFNNVFVCTANVGADMVSAILQVKMNRCAPSVIAVVPSSLVGKQREDHCAALGRLESDEVPFRVIAHSEDLVSGGGA